MANREGHASALTTYDPRHDARDRYPDWVIEHVDLRGLPEVMYPHGRVILVHDDGGDRAVGVAHAVAHLDLGHVTRGGLITDDQETAAVALAERRLQGRSHHQINPKHIHP